ncbi:hypothetical protein [Hathewaya massiliensis]|uniref:hypothetical protein n=1 Tax=Hathewaya massiliensis TaxID=1964382 RepID=UPI001157380D|nr:hypothetical protein [Hathewaya massiliensis]
MAKILGVNSINYVDKRKVQSKLSFNYGEKFSAKLCSLDKSTGEATLKLPNGWEFKAEVKDSLESREGKVLKFEVKDFSEGKLKLELVQNEDKSEIKGSLEKILNSVGLEGSEENIELLGKMLKHDITLSKENIMDMKNLLNLKEKISNAEDEENFIRLFMEKEGVDMDSDKGKFIYNTLKEFFKELKSSDLDLIMYLKENNIEITKENIESLNNLIKDTGLIGKDIESLLEKVIVDLGNSEEQNTSFENLKGGNLDFFVKDGEVENSKDVIIDNNDIKSKEPINPKEITLGEGKESVIRENSLANKEIVSNNSTIYKDESAKGLSIATSDNDGSSTKLNLEEKVLNSPSENGLKTLEGEGKIEKGYYDKNQLNNEGIDKNVDKNIINKDIDKGTKNNIISKDIEKGSENNITNKNIDKNVDNNANNVNKNSDLSTLNNNAKPSEEKNLSMNMEKTLNILLKENGVDLSRNISKELSAEVKNLLLLGDKVKEDIVNNLSTIKHNIKTLIKLMDENPKLEEQLIFNNLKGPINNLKVYNSLSNEYYYLDFPLNVKENEYPFKLIIKNKNKKNKKIDSKSAKIIASIKTINMGTIDNYITINNSNLEVKINAPKKYTRLLLKFKANLEEGLNDIGYNSHVIVQEKIEEVNLKNSCEFFDDKSFTTVNALI